MKRPCRTRRVMLAVLACAVIMLTASAQAGVACDPGSPTVLSVPRINVPANPVVGQVLGSPDGYPIEAAHGLRCTYTTDVIIKYWSYINISRDIRWTGQYLGHSSLAMPVYQTGVQGVGFAFMAQDRDGGPMRIVTTGNTLLRGPIHPGLATWGVRGRVFFVVTGPIQGGTVTPRTFSGLNLYTNPTYHAFNFGSIEIGEPSRPTCSVSTSTVAIALGAVESRAFKGIHSVAGNGSGTITLQCPVGSPQQHVRVTLVDQTQPANRSDRLSLTASSTAKGVALQVLFGGRVITYGPAAGARTADQPLGRAGANGTFELPLTAHYIQTAATIEPGTANGLATFTLVYR
ncbi:type 1 fimbrial protein [Pseudomonas salomonii]|uniref:Type 1 fimbrial protein n=1 Tax=Pseudomonas salomonii TaxID=191391 RepID=A0A7Y8GG13_9PSED|nr:fimbrial protein [Pseudomonas salomonii]NWF09491.1 type 1 fimbrial protein [Pseudomonas salomonii]